MGSPLNKLILPNGDINTSECVGVGMPEDEAAAHADASFTCH